MTKQGCSDLRKVLYMAAMAAVKKGDNSFAVTYQHLLNANKAKKSALGAVMRKMLVVMRAMVISGEDYSPCGKPANRRDQEAIST